MQSQEKATRDGQAESAQNMFSTEAYKEATLACLNESFEVNSLLSTILGRA